MQYIPAISLKVVHCSARCALVGLVLARCMSYRTEAVGRTIDPPHPITRDKTPRKGPMTTLLVFKETVCVFGVALNAYLQRLPLQSGTSLERSLDCERGHEVCTFCVMRADAFARASSQSSRAAGTAAERLTASPQQHHVAQQQIGFATTDRRE